MSIERLLRDEISLSEAIDATPQAIAGLRRQAEALYRSGKWRRCIALLEAVMELGDRTPLDPVMLSRCYDELGETGSAARWAEVAQQVLGGLDRIIAESKEGQP